MPRKTTTAKEPSKLGRLVNAGRKALTDPAILDQKSRWFRNGQRGALHAYEYCGSFPWRATRSTVMLSVAEAHTMRHCTECGDRAVDQSIRATLGRMRYIYDLLERAESPAAVKSLHAAGATLGQLQEVRDMLERLSDVERDRFRPGVDEATERVAAATAAVRATIGAARSGLVPMLVSSLCRVDVRNGYPGMVADDNVVFGPSFDSASAARRLDVLHGHWCKQRAELGDGNLDTVDAVVLDLVREADLVSNDQLQFPVTGQVDTDNLHTWMIDRWREELADRLTTRLLPAWHQAWNAYAAKTDTVFVPVPVSAEKEKTRAVLAAYPTASCANVRAYLVAVEEVVGLWLTRFEPQWGHTARAVPVRCDDVELLDIAAALWTPGAGTDLPYADLAAAIDAARDL